MPHTLSSSEIQTLTERVVQRMRSIPDFPKPGILFQDITPVLQDAEALNAALELHAHAIADLHEQIDVVVGIESRGFIFGTALALRLGAGFVVVRKPGKLPAKTIEQAYELEYGAGRLQIHEDGVRPGQKVILVDDLLATGGTASAARALVERLGGELLASVFLVELADLGGRARLDGSRVETLLTL